MMIPDDVYSQIVRVMPVPCVDTLIEDEQGRILLVKRADEPAMGQWWFPGGRVHYLERREQAAIRKVREECGLEALRLTELGTYDVILEMPDGNSPRHGITTLYHVRVRNHVFVLDNRSLDAAWRWPAQWKMLDLHEFITENLKRVEQE